MLGQSLSMLLPRVVGVRLHGALPEGATATDLVLTITELMRRHGVVGKFVEFSGPGVAEHHARRPGDHREHEPGVRLHLRLLPHRRRDPALPALHRPQRRAGRAGRGVRQGAGPVARARPAPPLLRARRARPVDGRAVAGRPAPPAGPRAARPLRRRSASRCRHARPLDADDRSRRGPTRRPRVVPGQRRPASTPTTRRGCRHRCPRTASRAAQRTVPSLDGRARSTTAPSPSPRSPRAPTPPTRR